MIYLVHPDMELWDFMIAGTKSRTDLFDIPLSRHTNRLHKAMRIFLRGKKVPAWFVLGREMRDILRKTTFQDVVIISAYTDPCLFHAVASCVAKGVRICLWMWNPIKTSARFKENIAELKKYDYELHSFDPEDCRKYGMTFHYSFYNMNVPVYKSENKWDFYFLGDAKDRYNKIKLVENMLGDHSKKFIVPNSPKEYITYSENIKYIVSSRCIVEVVQEEQYDITLRPFEALAFGKKLVTDSLAICNYSFYRPENVFIVGRDNLSSLDDFLKSPMIEIPEDIRREYDINTWLDSFK